MTMKLLPLFLASAFISSQAAAADVESVRQIVSDPKGLAAPGCAVGAFRGGETLLTTAAGASDIATGKPLNADTLFYAASISKQFTSLAAAILIDKGKIDLKDDVRKYIPELPRYKVPVTIEMLMHHTSGIRDFLSMIRLAGIESAGSVDKNTALKLLFSQKDTNFTPGTAYTYSNGGYLLLAEVIERVSGMPFSEFAARSILKPLGMTRSFFMNGTSPIGENIARGYVPIGDGFEIRDTYPRFSGSGGLMVSINDLAKFNRDIEVGHKIWTPPIQKIMLTPGTFTSGDPAIDKRSGLVYAAGLQVGARRGHQFVQHGGGAEAFKNMYSRLPGRNLQVAVFCNRGDWDSQEKSDAVIEAIEGAILTRGPSENVAGRYYSEDLQSTYDLSLDGETLRASISSPFATTPSPLEFKRNPEGGYRSKGITLEFDSGRQGFTIKMDRVTAIHFNRLN